MIEKEKLKTGLFINVVTPHAVEKKLWVYQIEVQSISDYCVNAKYPFKHCFWTTEEAETFKNKVEIQEFLETENKYRKLDKSLCDHKYFCEVLKYWRLKNGFNIYQLSKNTGINYHSIENIEAGKEASFRNVLMLVMYIDKTTPDFDLKEVYKQWRFYNMGYVTNKDLTKDILNILQIQK